MGARSAAGAHPPARRRRALALAIVAVGLAAGLRADSDGALPLGRALPVLALCVVGVGAVAFPLTGRERRLPALLAVLAASQVAVSAALLLAARGSVERPGATAWVCCAPAPGTRTASSPLAGLLDPTARGGLALVGAQLLAAAVLAGWLRALESAVWSIARGLGVVVRPLLRVLTTLLRPLLPSAGHAPAALALPDAEALRPALLVRTAPRRGPPARDRLSRPTVLPRLAAPVSC